MPLSGNNTKRGINRLPPWTGDTPSKKTAGCRHSSKTRDCCIDSSQPQVMLFCSQSYNNSVLWLIKWLGYTHANLLPYLSVEYTARVRVCVHVHHYTCQHFKPGSCDLIAWPHTKILVRNHLLIFVCPFQILSGIQASLYWFQSCIANRFQRVKILSLLSISRMLVTGVPQGSGMGPWAYSSYTSEIGCVILLFSIIHHLFADDMQLLKSMSV